MICTLAGWADFMQCMTKLQKGNSDRVHAYPICTLKGLDKITHTYVYTVYIQYFWHEIYHTSGHIRCTYTILANPNNLNPNPVTFSNLKLLPFQKRVHTQATTPKGSRLAGTLLD